MLVLPFSEDPLEVKLRSRLLVYAVENGAGAGRQALQPQAAITLAAAE